MAVILLAVLSSLAYGVADFSGGLAARRVPALQVAAVMLTVSLAVNVAALPVLGGRWSVGALAWGGAAGLVSAASSALLYKCLALGPMSVLSPVTAVVSAAVPAAVGFAAGERLSGLGAAGMVLALLAVVAVSASPSRASSAAAIPAGLPEGIASGRLAEDLPAFPESVPAAAAVVPAPSVAVASAAFPAPAWRRPGPGPDRPGPARPVMSRPAVPRLTALLLAVAAGAAIAAMLVFLSRSPHDSGITPLIACRAVSVAALVPVLAVRRAGRRKPGVREPGLRAIEQQEAGLPDPAMGEPGQREAALREPGRREAALREPGRREAGPRESGRREPGQREPGLREARLRKAGQPEAGQPTAGYRQAGRQEAGLAPAGNRIAAAGRAALLATRAAPGWLARSTTGPASAAGLLDAVATLAFLVAVRGGSLVIVAVITALYPAGTVLLARRVLAERLTRPQCAGLAAAAAAVTLLAVS